jgi:hypothetical protein
LILAYPSAKITPDSICVYAIALSELSPTELQAAVLKCMRTCKFFPSIAEIMEAANDMVEVASGTKAKSPDEAWNEVIKQMNEAFIYKKPVFSTPEIEKAALSMGWIGLCETPTDQLGTARAQFLRLYESVCKRKNENRINDNVLHQVGDIGGLQRLGDVIKQIGK